MAESNSPLSIKTQAPNVKPLVIHIIGLGVTQRAELDSPARDALNCASWVIGSERQLEVIDHLLDSHVNKKSLPPLRELSSWLNDKSKSADADKQIVVLASGDPLFYGIGRWFSKQFSAQDLHFYPAVSSIQAACHVLGLALQDTDVLSLHGRPLAQIRKTLKPFQTLIVLSDKLSRPQALAQECIQAGFLDATITVCETLGYAEQRITNFKVTDLSESDQHFDPLHLSVIKTENVSNIKKGSNTKALILPSFPGIPDEAFMTNAEPGKGMLTKREVRLAILSLMQTNNADVIWDIGAGCGSVAVELAYWNKLVQVHAIEHHADRVACLEQNRARFGVVSQLNIVNGSAPECLSDLPSPSKIFIGGSDGRLTELLQMAWEALPVDGLLVASAVTENSKQHLMNFMQSRENAKDSELETLQIAVSKGSQLAGQLVYRPSLAVSLFKFTKRRVL